MEGLSRSIPRRAPRRSHHPSALPHHLQPPPPRLPPLVPEELFFFSVFEQQYGGHHPFFYGCRFADAMRAARREGRLVFVYLHDLGHPYTEPFCRRTLCADVVVEFLDANFVSWGAVTGTGEGPGMVASLQPGSFPFCAVVAPVSDESIAVLQQVVAVVRCRRFKTSIGRVCNALSLPLPATIVILACLVFVPRTATHTRLVICDLPLYLQ